jgi:hypothetical protein
MSRENVEVVRCFVAPHDGQDVLPRIRESLERFGPDPKADVVLATWAEDPGWQYAHADLTWDTTAMGLGSAVCGPRGVALSWADWVERWDRYVYRMREYSDLGAWLLTSADVQATARDGLPVEMPSFQLWQIKDGKVIVKRAFLSEADALKAVERSE